MHDDLLYPFGHDAVVAVVEVALEADEALEEGDEGREEGAGAEGADQGAEEVGRGTGEARSVSLYSEQARRKGPRRTLASRLCVARG